MIERYDDDKLEKLLQRIAQLEKSVGELTHPHKRVFIAGPDEEDATLWKEQTVINGEIVPFVGGRGTTADTNDDFPLIPMPSGVKPVMRFFDKNSDDGVNRYQYVDLGGGGGVFLFLGDRVREGEAMVQLGGLFHAQIIGPGSPGIDFYPTSATEEYDYPVESVQAIAYAPWLAGTEISMRGGWEVGATAGVQQTLYGDEYAGEYPLYYISPGLKRRRFNADTGYWEGAFVYVPSDEDDEDWWANHWSPDIQGGVCT
jgi:hypothetical protein